MRILRWPIALLTLLFGKLARRPSKPPDEPPAVAQGTPERGAENAVLVLLGIASMFAIGFIVVYAEFSPAKLPNALLGVCLGLCFLFIGVALTVVAKRLVVTEELEDDYPEEHPEAQREIAKIVHDSGSRITRKRLLLSAGVATGGALGAAALTPALSLGPLWDTSGLDSTPWRAGRRLVDENGSPLLAANISERTFYTAFPEGADFENIGSPLVVLRVDPAKLDLPPGRSTGRPAGSSPSRRSAPTPGARSLCIASRRSRRSSRRLRSCARATTRRSTHLPAGPSPTGRRGGRCRSCRSRLTAPDICAPRATSPPVSGRRGGTSGASHE